MDSFPRQQARTQRFSLGVPRTITVSPDGRRVLFLRSAAGDDPVTALWEHLVPSGEERLLVDPLGLSGGEGGTAAGGETDAERARRERRREQASGIVSYDTDQAVTTAVFAVAGELWALDVEAAEARLLPVTGPVFDPRVEPQGRRVAWCCGRGVRVVGIDGADEYLVVEEGDPEVTWGQAEFVAAEETERDRGFWWAPDGSGLLLTRVDNTPVGTWWVTDPAHPERPPVAHRYPAAGTANAEVTLWYSDLAGGLTEVRWDRDQFPYLSQIRWDDDGGPLLVVEQRDHKACQVLEADPSNGSVAVLATATDPAWVGWPHGLPRRLDDGRLVWFAEAEDTVRLTVGEEVVTPPGLQVRSVVSAATDVLFTGSEEPTEIGLYRWNGITTAPVPIGEEPTGALGAAVGGSTVVTSSRVVDRAGTETLVHTPHRPPAVIASRAVRPVLTASVQLLRLGARELRSGVVLPQGHRSDQRLPVLLLPYGGPAHQQVMADQHAWLPAQWSADQGFAVVVTDGRGTPGRGPAWEREIYGDFATAVLEDQVAALQAAADAVPDLDLGRVGIAGWSFGGYLAALAVLRRPDVFHAAVAGAPVTDWSLYDTYYTERYLGQPQDDPAVYPRSSLLDDAPRLSRPLLLVHGLVDDNVVVAHSLRLSQRLVEAGRPHSVLPLSGITHMASSEEVAENLLLLQTDFLRRALPGSPA